MIENVDPAGINKGSNKENQREFKHLVGTGSYPTKISQIMLKCCLISVNSIR